MPKLLALVCNLKFTCWGKITLITPERKKNKQLDKEEAGEKLTGSQDAPTLSCAQRSFATKSMMIASRMSVVDARTGTRTVETIKPSPTNATAQLNKVRAEITCFGLHLPAVTGAAVVTYSVPTALIIVASTRTN